MTSPTQSRQPRTWLGIYFLCLASGSLLSPADVRADVPRSTLDEGAVAIDPDAIPRWCIGQIFIRGTDEVRDSIILEQCPLFPGKPASIADLREAERNLAHLGLFVVDRKRGIHPTVKLLERQGDNRFHDVEIHAEEKPNVRQILMLHDSIRFVRDWQRWGAGAAVNGAEGFPREILDLAAEGKLDELPRLLRDKFRQGPRGSTGYAPPAAVLP